LLLKAGAYHRDTQSKQTTSNLEKCFLAVPLGSMSVSQAGELQVISFAFY
jgi:hypothetical protein